MMILVRLGCILIGYVFGCFQTAYLVGKARGIDIREHGSGNAGTTNTLRVLGTKAAIIVFAGDLFKTVFAVLVVRFTLGRIYPDFEPLLCLYAGAGSILGHNYPIHLQFKGGKGIASTAGLMSAMHWLFMPFGFVLFFGNLAITHYVSIGSLLLYSGFFIEMIIIGQLGVFGVTQAVLIEMYIITFLLTVLAFYKHRANISRLLHHNESKTYLFKKKTAVKEEAK